MLSFLRTFRQKNILRIAAFVGLIFIGGAMWGDYYYYRVKNNVSGNWENYNSWMVKVSQNSGWRNAVSGEVPGPTNNIYLDGSGSLNLNSDVTVSFMQSDHNFTLTIKNGASLNLQDLVVETGKNIKITIIIEEGGKLILSNAVKNSGTLEIQNNGTFEYQGNNGQISITAPVWNGKANTNDWATQGNWVNNRTPVSGESITIPANCSYYPVLTENLDLGAATITIAEGAELSLNGKTLTADKINLNGTLKLTGGETLNSTSNIGGIAIPTTITHGTNSTIFFSEGTSTEFNYPSSLGYSIKNLTIDDGTKVKVTSALTIAGTLTVNRMLTVTGNLTTSKSTAGTGTVDVTGNLTIQDSGIGTEFTPKVKLSGTANQTISCPDDYSFRILSFEKSSDTSTVTFNNPLSISQFIENSNSKCNYYFNGNLTLTNGEGTGTNPGINANGGSTTFADGITVTSNNTTTFKNVLLEGSAELAGKNIFTDFTATGLAGKTLTVNGEQTVNGELKLSGTGTGNLSVTGTGKFILSENKTGGNYLSVSSSGPVISDGTTDGAVTYTAQNSVVNPSDQSAPAGWNILDSTINVWTGGGSTDNWNVAENWSLGHFPNGADTKVYIPAGISSYPFITDSIEITSISFGAGATLDVKSTGSLTVNSPTYTLPSNISGDGKLIVPSTQTLTVSGTVDIGIENNGTVDAANNTVFNKDFICGDSTSFTTGDTVTFHGNTDLTKITNTTNLPKNIFFYTDSNNEITFSPKKDTSVDNFYIWGKTKLEIDTSFSAGSVQVNSGEAGNADYMSHDFTSTITGGTLNITGNTGLVLTKCSSNGKNFRGNLIIDADVNVTKKIETHSGTTIQINSGKTVKAASFVHSATYSTPLANVIVAGSLSITDTMDLQFKTGSTEVTINAGGELKAGKITATTDSFTPAKDGETLLGTGKSITNKGKLIINKNFSLPSTFTYTDSSSSEINFGDGAEWNSSATVTKAVFLGDATITCANTITGNFTATDLGGKTLTVNAKQTIGGNLTLSGVDATHLLTVTGDGNGSFALSASQYGGKFLSVSKDGPVITDGTTPGAYTYTAENSSLAAGSTQAPAGWILSNTAMNVWLGGTAGYLRDWATKENWSKGEVPAATEVVYIPATTYDPVISAAATCRDLVFADTDLITLKSNATLTVNSAWTVTNIDTNSTGTIASTGKLTVPAITAAGLSFTSKGFETTGVVTCGNVNSTGSSSTSPAITAGGNLTTKNLTVTTGGTIVATGFDLVIGGDAMFRGNVEANSISVTGKTTLGLSTASITTTKGQIYTGEVGINTSSDGNSNRDHSFIAGEPVVFNGLVKKYSADAKPNLIIGSSTNSTNVTFKGTVNTSDFYNITVYGTATFDRPTSVTTVEAQTYNAIELKNNLTLKTTTAGKKITLGGDVTDVTGTSTCELTIDGETSFSNDVTITAAKVDFKKSLGTVSNKLTLNTSADFTGNNTFTNLVVGDGTQASAYTIRFDGGSEQSFTSITSKGSKIGDNIHFVTFTNKSGANWKATVTSNDFEYTKIDNSTSTTHLGLSQSEATVQDAGIAAGGTGTTLNWFAAVYYWLGGTTGHESDWDKGTNWSLDGTTPLTLADIYPEYTIGTDSIVITNSADQLTLPGDIKVNEITVNEDATLDFGTNNIKSSKITNMGTLKMNGSNTITCSSFDQNTNSTIEYYGSVLTSLPWNSNTYNNLVFSDGAAGTVSADLTVNGTTTINTTSSMTFSGSNTFTKKVTVTDAGTLLTFTKALTDVELETSENISFAGNNTFSKLTANDEITLVFADSSFQKITDTFTATGADADHRLTLGNNTNNWNIYFDKAKATFQYVTVKNSTSRNNDNTANNSLSYVQSNNGIKEDASYPATAWFSRSFYWFGKTDNKWTTVSNWYSDAEGTSVLSIAPDYTNGTSQIIVKNATTDHELNLGAADLQDEAVKLDSLEINSTGKISLGDEKLTVAGTLTNNGIIEFTDAGRIYNADPTPALIMDAEHGTVSYAGTGTTFEITDIHNGTNATADYYDLVIESGTWTIADSATAYNNNIKAAHSFTINSGATLVMADTSEINSDLTNNGTLEIAAGTAATNSAAAIWADFTNNGTVTQNDYSTIWFAEACTKIIDNKTWTFGTSAGISFYADKNGPAFEIGQNTTTTGYSFTVANGSTHTLTFKGYSATKLLGISKWNDAGIASDAVTYDFQNVEFLDDSTTESNPTINKTITSTAGNLTFSDDAVFKNETTLATSGKITIASGKTLTTEAALSVTNGTVDLKGSITSTDVSLTLKNVNVSGNAALSAKKIEITGSIVPETSAAYDLSLTATGTDAADTIKVGSDSGAQDISIGTESELFKNISLTTTNQDIAFGENCKLHASGTISATGKNVTFANTIIANALVIDAQEQVSLNGLKATSFTITGSATKPTAVNYAGKIELTGTADFVIDYPATITADTEFVTGGNFILTDKTTPYARTGSIIPDIAYNAENSRILKITAGTGKEIQLYKTVGSSANKFTSVNFYSPVNFETTGLTLYAVTSNFGAGSNLASANSFAISNSLIVGGTFIWPVASQFTIPGSCTIDGSATFANGVKIGGNFVDNGTWSGVITLTGTGTNSFYGRSTQKTNKDFYTIIVNKTDGVVNFARAISIKNLDVTTNSYQGIIRFSGDQTQTFYADSGITYANVDVSKRVTNADDNTFTVGTVKITNDATLSSSAHGTFKAKTFTVTSGSAGFENMDVTVENSINWSSKDPVYITGGESGSPVKLISTSTTPITGTYNTIATKGSIQPTDTQSSYIEINSSAGGNILIGANFGDIDHYYKSVTLNSGTSPNTRTIEVKGQTWTETYETYSYSAAFQHQIHTWNMIIHASEISINGLKTKTLSINPLSTDPTDPVIKLGGEILLTESTGDFIINYPLQVLKGVFYESDEVTQVTNPEYDLVLEIKGNIIIKDTPRLGRVNSEAGTKRKVKFITADDKNLQVQNGGSNNEAIFGNTVPLDKVTFACDVVITNDTNIIADTVEFAGSSPAFSANANGDPEVTLTDKAITVTPADKSLTITGDVLVSTNATTAGATVKTPLNISGNFTDTGKWATAADEGTITFTGTTDSIFKGSADSVYKNVVLAEKNLSFQGNSKITTLAGLPASDGITVGYIDSADSSNNINVTVEIGAVTDNTTSNTLGTPALTINKGSTLLIGTATPSTYSDFTHKTGTTTVDGTLTANNITLGVSDKETIITGSIIANSDVTLYGKVISKDVADADKATLPAITAGTDKSIIFGNSTSDKVTYSGPNLYLNSNTDNKSEFTNNGTLTANADFTNYGSFVSTTETAVLNLKKDFTDNGTWTSKETLILNGTGTQNFTPQTTGSTYNKILIQKDTAATEIVNFAAGYTLNADTVTIEKNNTTNFNGPVVITTLNDASAASANPGAVTVNKGGSITTATLNTTGDFTVTSADGLTITNLTHTTGETKVNGTLTLSDDSTVGTITIAATDGVLNSANDKTITVKGDWNNNNTYIANGGIVTFDGTTTYNIDGTTTFNTVNIIGTATVKASNTYATLNIANRSVTDNSDPLNPVTTITASEVTFTKGTTQTVTDTLSLKGDDGKLLKILSSSGTTAGTAQTDCFKIDFKGTISSSPNNPDIDYVDMQNGYNASTNADSSIKYITLYHSEDSGNNWYWNFNGCVYTWTGTTSTDWFTPSNWDRLSIPGQDVVIQINEKYGTPETAVTQWPLLTDDSTRNISGNVDLGNDGTLTVGTKAQLDISTYNLAAKTITNNGLIKIRGVTGQTVSGTMENGTGSTIEYYDASPVKIKDLPWDGDSATAGKQYANLKVTGVLESAEDITCSKNAEFTDDITVTSVSVTGTTDFTKASAQKLTGNATFNGAVTSTSDLELAGNLTVATTLPVGAAAEDVPELSITAPLVTFSGTVDSSTEKEALAITGNAEFKGDAGTSKKLAVLSVSGTSVINTAAIKTAGTQTYTDAVTVDSSSELTATKVTFTSTVNGKDEDETLKVSGNADFNADISGTKKLASLEITGQTTLSSSISFNCDTTFGNNISGSDKTITLAAGNTFSITGTSVADTTVLVEPSVINNAQLTAGNSVVFKNTYAPAAANTFISATGANITFNKDVDFSNTTFTHGNGTITLNPAGTNLTITGSDSESQEFNTVEIKGSVIFTSGNTFNTLKAENLENKTITFPAGDQTDPDFEKKYLQKILTSLTLTGKADEDNKYLILRSSSTNSDNLTDCFYINFGGTVSETSPYQPLIQYVDMENGYNTTVDSNPYPVFLTCRNSADSGNNWFWNFPGCRYYWTGSTSADWFVRTNWNRKSVPGGGALVYINKDYNGTAITTWPDLGQATLPAGLPYIMLGSGEISVGADAVFDINSENLSAAKISNSGNIRIKGTDAAQTITATRDNKEGSTVHYYSGTAVAPTINLAWGTAYANLHIEDAVNSSDPVTAAEKLIINNSTVLSGVLNVTGITQIETSENVTLSGANIFAGEVVIDEVNDVELNSAAGFTLKQTDSAPLNTILVQSPVTLLSSIVSASAQTYNGEVTLTASTTLKEAGSTAADVITLNAAVSGSFPLILDGNLKVTTEAPVAPSYIKAANTQDVTWNSVTTANINSDLYIDCEANQFNLTGNFTANNIYMYNGTLNISSGKTFKANNNFAVWGANYSATDKRYSTSNTRFAYFTPAGFSFAYTQPAAKTSILGTLTGAAITVCGNFYLNGTDLPAVTLNLPDNAASNPVFNTTDTVTEKQWGVPYAVTFNSTITGVTVNTGYLAAALEQDNIDGADNNENVQFKVPEIAAAYTVYDDVIYIAFNVPVENSHNEINTNLATALADGTVANGSLWYNNITEKFAAKAYKDADCTTPVEEDKDITTADANGFYGFYVRTYKTENNSETATWNTDADGLNAYSPDATLPEESTTRSAVHHNVTVDLAALEGLFTAAQGHTMSSNYGVNFQADGTTEAERYTATEDHCAPVLLAAYAGQENHEPDASAQTDYDAHNFIEFRYSEPVNIGDGTTTLLAIDGDNNIHATDGIGHITGNGTGSGFSAPAGKGLTIAGLAVIADGQLNAANKEDSSSPHSLYRTYSVEAGNAPLVQTNRVRVSIAGYVNGTAGDTCKNWVGYIDYSKIPESGTKVTAINNTNLTDIYGNPIDVTGTDNHPITTEFLLNKGVGSKSLSALYGTWDSSRPVFAPIRKIKRDYESDYEAIPTGNGTAIDKIEIHILDGDYSDDNIFFVFAHGWSEKLTQQDENEYWYALKPGFQAADDFGGSRAFNTNSSVRTGGGVRYSSIYGEQIAFKYGLSPDAVPELPFTSIKTGATSGYFSGTGDDTRPIPTTMDNPYITLGIPDSTYGFQMQFSVNYSNTNAYITDLAGNRLQSATFTTIDRTPPDYHLTLAPISGSAEDKGELYIVFAKRLKTEGITVGNYKHDLFDIFPSIVEFGTIDGSFVKDTTLKVESVEEYEPLTKKGKTIGAHDFAAFKLTLNRAITLDDVKEKYMRITYPEGESEFAPDPFTLAEGSRVTYIQDDDMISYLPMYKAHPLSDFAINAIVPEYAYDSDLKTDDSIFIMRNPANEIDEGSWAVHDWTKDQKNYGTLPYGDSVSLITSIAAPDKNTASGLDFTLHLSNVPDADSAATQYNKDFDMDTRLWLPELTGTTPFEPLAPALNTNFDSVASTSTPDFDKADYPNRLQFNFDQKNYKWEAGDQIKFLFSLNGYTIMHTPENTNDGSSYSGVASPVFALRTESILKPDITTLDLWSFRLKSVATQRGGVSIYNNVINVYKVEKTIIKVNMPKEGHLKVMVMTLDGNIVKYLENTNSAEGEHIYYWDGTNNRGNMVARGMYFIRVIGQGLDETRKVMCVNEK